jgi:transposase
MAIAFTLIETAKLNKVDPQAWLTWVPERISEQKNQQARRADAVELW